MCARRNCTSSIELFSFLLLPFFRCLLESFFHSRSNASSAPLISTVRQEGAKKKSRVEDCGRASPSRRDLAPGNPVLLPPTRHIHQRAQSRTLALGTVGRLVPVRSSLKRTPLASIVPFLIGSSPRFARIRPLSLIDRATVPPCPTACHARIRSRRVAAARRRRYANKSLEAVRSALATFASIQIHRQSRQEASARVRQRVRPSEESSGSPP